MRDIHDEAATFARYHNQIIDLMTAFEALRPNWQNASSTDAWNTHFIVLEHLHIATLPQTPTTVRLTLFGTAEGFAREVEGQLEPGLLEAGQYTITLARQLANIPPVI